MQLSWAAATQGAATTALLLDAGADPNARFTDNSTALLAACSAGSTDIAIMLLDKGADVLYAKRCGTTALQAAAASGSIDIVGMLLDAGADKNVDAADVDGDTALMCASRGCHAAVVRALLVEDGVRAHDDGA